MSREDCELQKLLPQNGYVVVATGHCDDLVKHVQTLLNGKTTYRIVNYYSFVLGTFK